MKKYFIVYLLSIWSLLAIGQIPTGYYNDAEGKSGAALRQAVQTIAGRGLQTHGYNWDVDYTDQVVGNSSKVKLIYTLKEEPVGNHKSSGYTGYNREHVWPKSLMPQAFTWDNHNLRASEPAENGKRSNKKYGDYLPPDVSKGDAARICFYMAVLHNWDVNIVGRKDMLVSWSTEDNVDEFEKQRNNRLQERQGNRNPFIDHPELVDYIWGSKVGQVWNNDGDDDDDDDDDDGEDGNGGEETVIYTEAFNQFPNGWTTKKVDGKNDWRLSKKFQDNTAAQMSGFSKDGSAPKSVSWLISPEIAIEEDGLYTFNFESKNGYYKGDVVTVYVTDNYTGDPATTEWDQFNARFDNVEHKKEDGSLGWGEEYVPSGEQTLAGFSDNIRIAFKYDGTSDKTTSMKIDNINVIKKPLAVENVTAENNVVYPNPSANFVIVGGAEEGLNINVYNTSGQLVKQSQKSRINIQSLNKGLYVVSYKGRNGQMHTAKFLKK
ncbi:MAG: endonuclease [Hyphomicrobiales bacterium]